MQNHTLRVVVENRKRARALRATDHNDQYKHVSIECRCA
jgi:hypothetical protein